jgi:Arc/MetJ-type ribon-helix-helix transcriptional regulator
MHSQHEGLKSMTDNKDTMPKIRRSVTISEDLMKWINEQIERKRFKDVSHAIEYALFKLKEGKE